MMICCAAVPCRPRPAKSPDSSLPEVSAEHPRTRRSKHPFARLKNIEYIVVVVVVSFNEWLWSSHRNRYPFPKEIQKAGILWINQSINESVARKMLLFLLFNVIAMSASHVYRMKAVL